VPGRSGPRLQPVLRWQDTIARLGGDEFAVVLPQTTAQQAEHMAVQLRKELTEPFIIEGYPVDVDPSVTIRACLTE
jgi:diguanylate cyclase (GGDEF)-like protein